MTGLCRACGWPKGPMDSGQWCHRCVVAWREAGRPDTGPPPRHVTLPERRKTGKRTAPYLRRLRRYMRLRREGRTSAEIAAELSVSDRTICRYAVEVAYMHPKDFGNPKITGQYFPAIVGGETGPASADEETLTAWHIAAHCADVKDALLLADVLGLPMEAFRKAREA